MTLQYLSGEYMWIIHTFVCVCVCVCAYVRMRVVCGCVNKCSISSHNPSESHEIVLKGVDLKLQGGNCTRRVCGPSYFSEI